MTKPEIIIALDTWEYSVAEDLIESIPAPVFKVGLELIYSTFLDDVVGCIRRKKAKLFFDAKLSDIPSTVASATHQICWNYEPDFLTVRTALTEAMEVASSYKRASGAELSTIVDVAQLTSDDNFRFIDTVAKAVVCPPVMAKTYRHHLPNHMIICPGVRLEGEETDDHTGPTSIPMDADYIVVGRPIRLATKPLAVYNRYVDEINKLGEMKNGN